MRNQHEMGPKSLHVLSLEGTKLCTSLLKKVQEA